MTIQEWNLLFKSCERSSQDPPVEPTPLLKCWANQLTPGRALDLACGTGRNALYLAAKGWKVEAVDGAESAIARVCKYAQERNLKIRTAIADLTSPDFVIQPESWDLLAVCYYLQRNRFPAIPRDSPRYSPRRSHHCDRPLG